MMSCAALLCGLASVGWLPASLPRTPLASGLGAAKPRVGGQAAILSRREAIGTAVAAAAFAATPFACAAADEEPDPLYQRLGLQLKKLEGAKDELAAQDYDGVRRTVADITTLLNTKGYLGDSVKARARGLGDDGAALDAARKRLLVNMFELDKFCFDGQLKVAARPAQEGVEALDACVASLNAVMAKM